MKNFMDDRTASIPNGTDQGEGMLHSFLAMLWSRKGMVAGGLVLGVMIAAIYLHLATHQYTASLQVTSVSAQPQLPSGLSGLASLAGVSLRDDEVSPVSLYVETLKSEDVAVLLARDQGDMRHLFPEHWNRVIKRWQVPESLLYRIGRVIKGLLGYPAQSWHQPDAKDLRRYISKHLAITKDSRNNLTLIAFNDVSPDFAVRFLKKMHAKADGYLRARALQQANQSIAYLRRRLMNESNADYRTALVDLLRSQERLKMLASSRSDFAAQPLGSVSVSARPTTPNPLAVLAFGAISGLGIGSAFAAWSSKRVSLTRRTKICE